MGNAGDAGQRTRVRPARDEDVPALVEVMVAAFADDPVHHWLYPDAGTRPDVHRRLFAFLLRCGLRHGGVWTDTGLRGMALWVAPGEQEMTDDETDVYLRMRREDMGERAGPVGEALWAIGASAPAEPFALLDFLAVHPHHQGQGLGTALATPVLDRCDADGASAWLVSSSPRPQPLPTARLPRQRHGAAGWWAIDVGDAQACIAQTCGPPPGTGTVPMTRTRGARRARAGGREGDSGPSCRRWAVAASAPRVVRQRRQEARAGVRQRRQGAHAAYSRL